MNLNIVYIETYGCAANQNNSEIMAGMLSRAGFIITNNQEIAEIIILNTCIVKSKTESKIQRRIQDLKNQSQTGKNKLVIIAGCVVESEAKNLKKLNPSIIFLGTHHTKDILNLIRDYKEKKLGDKKQSSYLSNQNEIKLNTPKQPQNSLISIHQISEGCLGDCTFCKTRLAKGKLYSYPKEEIIKSIESDLQNHAKEIWITSQDNAAYGLDWANSREVPSKKTSDLQELKSQKFKISEPLGVLDKDNATYGLDKGKSELIELLKEILSLKYKFKLRLGMMNPNNVLPILNELIEVYKTNPKLYKFLHIPIQSASNPVLKHMNRHYTLEQAEHIIKKFKEQIPNITIATDIIVGYPTETEQDHQKNINFIRDFKPDVLNISKFSSHKLTPAGKLKPIKNSIINEQTSELMQLHRKTAQENKQIYKDKILKVFINKKISDNLHEARDENYNIILLKCDKSLLGKEIQVKIKEIGVHHLIGEIIKEENISLI